MSVKIAKDVIEHPPSDSGYFHLSIASRSVFDNKVGGSIPIGSTQALSLIISLEGPSPLKFVAVT